MTITGRRRTAAAPAPHTSPPSPSPSDYTALLEDFPVPPPPVKERGERANILVCGIGGTGVVTLGAILARAAAASGLHVNVFDQVGLSQKNGSVVSHIRIARHPILAPRIAPGAATCLLAADLVTAVAPANLAAISRQNGAVAGGAGGGVGVGGGARAVVEGGGAVRGVSGAQAPREGCTEVVANTHMTMPGSFARFTPNPDPPHPPTRNRQTLKTAHNVAGNVCFWCDKTALEGGKGALVKRPVS